MTISPPLPNPVSFSDTMKNMAALQNTFQPDICDSGEPLIKFDDTGHPPLLDFNLPQSTAFTTYGRINVPVDPTYFKAFTKLPPANNYWKMIETMTPDQINQMMNQNVLAQPTTVTTTTYMPVSTATAVPHIYTGGIVGQGRNINPQLAQSAVQPINMSHIVNEPVFMQSTSPKPASNSIGSFAAQRLRPMMVKRVLNVSTITKYVAEPPVPRPMITIVEEYSTTSYLGNYGAGRVVKTLSLMPGERTTISVRTYKDMSSTKDSAQNILDSFSDTSATELDNLMQIEQGNITSTSDTSGGSSGSFSTNTEAHNSQSSFNVSANISAFGFGVGGGYGQSSSDASSGANGWNNAANYSHNGARTSNVNTINNALDKHVQASNSNRQINVNTSTSDTASSGEEDSTVRELINYNKSRVLNFTFRQLLQEYTVITSLVNLKFVYTNGYPESFTMVDLNNLDNMIADVIADGPDPLNPEEYRDKVKCALLQNYCQVLDYNDDLQDFLDRKTVTAGKCFMTWLPSCTPKDDSFWRVKKDLEQVYDPTGANITVKGVILSVQKQTLQTSSVIADALLGRGEALDCYNQKAQDAESLSALISNMSAIQSVQDSIQNSSIAIDVANQSLEMGDKKLDKMQAEIDIMSQQMDVITSVTTPADQVTAYKKVFGSCCPTPQYTGGCGCGKCEDCD